MAKDDRYVRFSSQGRISPDEIANRAFSTQFRGLSEPEVRAWLKRVAAEVDSLHEQEAQLALRLEEAEGRSSTPVELTEERLLTALGEETARVLRSAQEAAADIRRRAEDRSTTVLREAQEEARRIREEAEELLATRTGEAEALASEVLRSAEDAARAMRSEAETAATELRARAAREAEESDEAARRSGREIVEEAQAVRERVLSDLSTRRTLLQAQLEELRAGRDRLIDAYRTVKRTLAEATEALAQVESRASTELTTGPTAVVGVAGGGSAIGGDRAEEAQPRPGGASPLAVGGSEGTGRSAVELEVAEALPEAVGRTGPEPDTEPEPAEPEPAEPEPAEPEPAAPEPAEPEQEVEAVPTAEAAPEPEGAPEGEPERHDRPTGGADEIFARLRSSSDAETDSGEAPAREAGDGGRATAQGDAEIDLPGEEAEGEPRSEVEPAHTANSDGMLDEALLQRRDEALEPEAAALARRLKRIVQDEQNALLDSLRRHRGSGGFDLLLPDADVQLAERVAVSAPSVDACYREGMLGAGATVAGSERAPEQLVIMLARALTEPLRARVADGMRDAASRGEDEAGIAETVNARYREWKQQSLESHVVEALAAAFARGTYDALAAGAALRWIVDDPTACPDCDDNSLEVTMKGEPFPTGQLCPPAHPGCRCALRVVGSPAVVAAVVQGSGSAS